ncbi:MAG: HU family DNA-binding protein [Deltaproteobacteria bacterium]|nr:HU family DNA-binding protein [Deltaproteobacteria bacterium]
MTKAELISKIADQAQVTKVDAEKTLNALINGITNILQTEGKLTLAGFGTFTVGERQERQGRNPQTGKPMKIAAARSLTRAATMATAAVFMIPRRRVRSCLRRNSAILIFSSKRSSSSFISRCSKAISSLVARRLSIISATAVARTSACFSVKSASRSRLANPKVSKAIAFILI